MNYQLLIISTQASEIQQILAQHKRNDQPNTSTNKPNEFTFEILADFSQLFDQLSRQVYHLLLVDMRYVESAPERFFTELQATQPRTALVVLAAEDKRRQVTALLPKGIDDYLLTPLNPVEVRLKVERTLEYFSMKSKSESKSESKSLHQANLSSGVEQLLLLNEATQEIIQTLDPDTVLNDILIKAGQITGAEFVKIYLTDKSETLSERRCKVLSNSGEYPDDEVLFTLVQDAAMTQQALSREIVSSQPDALSYTYSVLINPIVSREKLLGVLALARYQAQAFSNSHRQWLSIFCSQVAIAIENANLFQNLSSAYISLAQNREKILQSRNTLQVIFNGISDGLCILDQDLTVNALNRVEAARQGGHPEQLINKNILSLQGYKNAPELIEQIKESLSSGKETTWASPKDESNHFLKDREFRIYPIRNRMAQSEQVVVFAQDVSERRRWQASLFRSANLAAVGQLAGSVAHQINNPLTVTMTNSQLILLDSDPQTETFELATGILRAGERIQNIITNLLEFSNQERYFFVQTDLIETIEGALALVIRSLKKININVVKNYRARPMLSASVSHLKLVWINLLLNARDALGDQTEDPQITISTQPVSAREVKIKITDNGPGIAEKDMEQLFRPFFTTKPVGKALGLGLYSAHAIIERHHGHINVSSQPRVATTFEVVLPLDNPRDL